jgi:hypothetical protein
MSVSNVDAITLLTSAEREAERAYHDMRATLHATQDGDLDEARSFLASLKRRIDVLDGKLFVAATNQ